MDHFEMVEKLRERTGVSYEDAKDALDRAEWDLLDAIVLLESEGKVAQGAQDYSTRREETRDKGEHRSGQFKSTMSRIGKQLGNWIAWANGVNVSVSRNGNPMFGLPLTAVVVIVILCFPWIIPVLIVSLFFGVQYNVHGNDKVINSVNQAMDKVSEFADNIKQEVQSHKQDDQNKDNQ